MAVFNDNPLGKPSRLKLGYGTANKARASIRKLKQQPLSYQTQVGHTLYFRAKYHKHQTKGMRNAMKLYGNFLQTLKHKKKEKSKGKQPSKQ